MIVSLLLPISYLCYSVLLYIVVKVSALPTGISYYSLILYFEGIFMPQMKN